MGLIAAPEQPEHAPTKRPWFGLLIARNQARPWTAQVSHEMAGLLCFRLFHQSVHEYSIVSHLTRASPSTPTRASRVDAVQIHHQGARAQYSVNMYTRARQRCACAMLRGDDTQRLALQDTVETNQNKNSDKNHTILQAKPQRTSSPNVTGDRPTNQWPTCSIRPRNIQHCLHVKTLQMSASLREQRTQAPGSILRQSRVAEEGKSHSPLFTTALPPQLRVQASASMKNKTTLVCRRHPLRKPLHIHTTKITEYPIVEPHIFADCISSDKTRLVRKPPPPPPPRLPITFRKCVINSHKCFSSYQKLSYVKALAAAALSFSVGVAERELRGELGFFPVHDRSRDIQRSHGVHK